MDKVFSVLLGVIEVLGSDMDVVEAEEDKSGNLVDTVVTVVLGESEVENWKVVKVVSDAGVDGIVDDSINVWDRDVVIVLDVV